MRYFGEKLGMCRCADVQMCGYADVQMGDNIE